MNAKRLHVGDIVVVERRKWEDLLLVIASSGYELIGPTIRDGAIVYDRLTSPSDLPVGWTDEQEAGKYRLKRRQDQALFGYAVGPYSWKMFLHPPVRRLWRAKRKTNSFYILPEKDLTPKYAFIGVRPCELHAINLQDQVFLDGAYADPEYQHRRKKLFVLVVNCGVASGTCFCVSMGTGPRVTSGFDLAVTEVLRNNRHDFVVNVGSERGAKVLSNVHHQAALDSDIRVVEAIAAETVNHMGRTLDTEGIKELLYDAYEHPRWDHTAARCLTCSNCTMVCPTCFCTTVEDVTDITGKLAERWQKWDSCFTVDFSYIHGGSVRATTKSRYRQWITHKLATWIDQFGRSGCVGCGRCITWCPVGIDLTEELRAIRESPLLSQEKSA
jgi:ferredoxin